MKPYSIYVIYSCIPGKRGAFLKAMAEAGIAEKVRAEEGCIFYDYYIPLENDNDILLLEKWESKEHQQRHCDQPHMVQLRAIKPDYVAEGRMGEFHLD